MRGIVMIKIEDYEIFKNNLSTLKETSKSSPDGDSGNIKYMTNSTHPAVNFDVVKRNYVNKLNLSEETASSFDSLVLFSNFTEKDQCVFIEFKDGKMKNEKRKLKDKIRDGLLVFCDIVKTNISETRKNIDFILVYNEEKNPIASNQTDQVIGNSRNLIQNKILKKAKEELIRFDLERFKTLIVKVFVSNF